MDKKEMFDSLDNFSQNLMMSLAELDAVKRAVQSLTEENTSLRLENTKLRDRLAELESQSATSDKQQVSSSLQKIHDDGFHICNVFYGQRRENDESCAFCLELLYRG